LTKKKTDRRIVIRLIDVDNDREYKRIYMKLYRALLDGPKNKQEKEALELLKRARNSIKNL